MSRQKAHDSVQLSYPQGVSWKCIRCSRCCGDTPDHERQILLLHSEACQISRTTGLVIEDFAESTDEPELYVLRMRKKDGRCVFLDGRRCKIYEVRPMVCRFYPIWLRKEGSKFTFGVTEECPGLGKGRHLDKDFFASLLKLAETRLSVHV